MTSPPEPGAASGVACPTCSTTNPSAARFCATCGTDITSGDSSRSGRYAVNPNESVASFALISTIMPHAAGKAPQTYRLALLVALAFPVIAGVLGAVSFALITAALVVPVVYTVYLYDVNLWEDNPVAVVLGALGASAVLSLLFTLLWREGLFADSFDVQFNRAGGALDLTQLLVLCLLVPVAAVVLSLIGPVVLASRPTFDDLMDGLTFGIVAGVGWAAIETLVLNLDVLTGPAVLDDVNGAFWLSLLLNAAIIKPIVYGSAIGIAAAQFSGLGEGYDGYTPSFFARVGEAIGFIAIFNLGLYLTGLIEGSTGATLGMLWGLLVAGVLLVRVRTVLHRALVEAAVEAAAKGGSKWQSEGQRFCGECEMPLLGGASFCIVCGTSVRAQSKAGRTVSSSAAKEVSS